MMLTSPGLMSVGHFVKITMSVWSSARTDSRRRPSGNISSLYTGRCYLVSTIVVDGFTYRKVVECVVESTLREVLIRVICRNNSFDSFRPAFACCSHTYVRLYFDIWDVVVAVPPGGSSR